MITKNEIKFIKSLQQKKYRIEYKSFVVEGEKMVDELIASDYNIKYIFAIEEWKPKTDKAIPLLQNISLKELKTVSSLKTPNKVLAIAEQQLKNVKLQNIKGKLSLVLDKIQDPGNMGTILRIADWFGIESIISSSDSVEIYNPKVVQATMGSIFRVNVFYTYLKDFLNKAKKETDLKIYGTLLDGENIYNLKLDSKGLIILGNESEGISEDLIPFIDEKLLISNFSKNNSKTESLNVAVAAAIICSEFKRNKKAL